MEGHLAERVSPRGCGRRFPQAHLVCHTLWTPPGTHFAFVRLLEPLPQADEAALLHRGQVPQVPLDVVCIQLI